MTRKLLTLAVLALFVSASPLVFVDAAFAKGKSGSHSSGKSKGGGKSSSKGGGSSGSHASAGGGKGGGGGGGGGGGKSGGGGGGKSDNPLDTAKSMMGVLGGVLGKK